MPARDQQQQIGRLQAFREADGERMRLQMIDRDQRQLVHERQSLGGRDADQQAADQPRPGRHRHSVKLVQADTRLAHSLGNDLVEALHVRPRGNLRHHAAVAAVLLPLRAHDVGQDAPAPVRGTRHDRRRRLVAARLDAEHQRLALVLGRIHGASFAPAPGRGHKRAKRCPAPPSIGRSALASIHHPHRHARLAAGAGAGARGARAPGGRARAGPMGVRGARHQDLGRPHPGPPARRGRRQGPLHQGDRGGAAGRRDRPRRALHEGHADAAAGGPDGRLLPAARGRARRLHQQQGCHARRAAQGSGGRHLLAAAPGAGQAPAARPHHRAHARQRRDEAAQARRTAPPMRRCSPVPA